MLADFSLVSQLIPQGKPMIMVEKLISNDEINTISSFTILSDNIFCDGNNFCEPGLIENIAQTAALRSGYMAHLKKIKPSVGFIGSVKRLKINQLPKVGDELITKVTIESEMLGALVISGEIKIGDNVVAEGTMNIFLQ